MSVKAQDILMVDWHKTFIFSGGGTITEQQWSFSAIDIRKAILKMKFENAPSSALGQCGFRIEYFENATLTWRTLGEIKQGWCGTRWCSDASGEFDVTAICRANPKFKWRAILDAPFFIYYSCWHGQAYLYLEYTAGEVEAQGVSSTSPFGNMALAPLAEGFNLMMNMMFMMMFMSLMMSVMTSMAEAATGAGGV